MSPPDQISNELTGRGSLQVSVFDTTVGRPLQDARVRVSRNGTDLGELTTDSSGQTQVMELPTPPLDYSLAPNEPKPYAEYNVTVVSQEFESLILNGVQILPDTRALQDCRLIPVQPPVPMSQDINIEQHTLWGVFPPKIPEDEVKPLPDAGGLVVLPQPVIPEFVIVHLGAPTNTGAQNVWIPFKDYIKNVASCEIYSTWPEQTIRANVYAILSFTMNRVYTEWYRGKGYDFTITNSTAYDQAFDYGRNIYEEISVVVDDIFTFYVTRPGIRQPLLTQYCDGSRTQCDGLTQWGSKNLGDQGLDALSILRNFYGYDVFLKEAEKVEGVPRSYPGSPLQMGSSGQPVRTIQEQLNAISNNYPAIQKVRVDGVFGQQTQDAVKQFQQIFDLPQTGVVDMGTWYQISNIYVAVSKLAQ
ncbi:MAG: peptidoglycan-binding protein [Oscillospiraceae bacterium]|nr:peptidoglycan-binding protein [Oscillospiraceae bacterium]